MSEQFSFDFFDEPQEEKKTASAIVKKSVTEKKFFVSCGLLNEKIYYTEEKPFLTYELPRNDIIKFLTEKNNMTAVNAENFINEVQTNGEKIYLEYDGYSIF